jgi:hypothetical protein
MKSGRFARIVLERACAMSHHPAYGVNAASPMLSSNSTFAGLDLRGSLSPYTVPRILHGEALHG